MNELELRDFQFTVKAMIEAMGMVAENQCRISAGSSPVYNESHFQKLLEDNELTHNQICVSFQNRQGG